MTHFTDTFNGKLGKIFYQYFTVDKSKGCIMLIHGLAEYADRYKEVIQLLLNNKLNIYTLDHYGHGHSEGTRSDIDSYMTYIEDMNKLYSIMTEKEGIKEDDIASEKKKVFCLGHSMGALLSILFTELYPKKINRIILSGSAVHIEVSQFLIKISNIIATLFPLLGVQKLDANFISHDHDIVSAYINDPLVYTGKVRARLGRELLKGAEKALMDAEKINIPILIMHGEQDKLANPQGSLDLFNRVSSKDKTLKMFKNLYHEIFNEKLEERKKVLTVLDNWINKRL